jgi:co-chaperonin GroES (HSP10)
MAYQKLQVSRALQVIKSDNANIPYPNVVETGTSTSVVANQLVDSTGTFVTLNVQVGDVVYNTTTSTAATINQVVNNTTIILNADIFLAAGNAYIIYSQNAKNEGCVLYIGTGGNIRVLTHGGDDVIFTNLIGGTFLPVQILKVFSTSTTASGIIALW